MTTIRPRVAAALAFAMAVVAIPATAQMQGPAAATAHGILHEHFDTSVRPQDDSSDTSTEPGCERTGSRTTARQRARSPT
jgi:hypothetical protein